MLASRLSRYRAPHAEALLGRDASLFEYWGHEASWLPMRLYPAFRFRREGFRTRPWWTAIVERHPDVVRRVLSHIDAEGPTRSTDLGGESSDGSWYGRPVRQVLAALWSSGELAVVRRERFQRVYDLAERVIPRAAREDVWTEQEAVRTLCLQSASTHGWITARCVSDAWRLGRRRAQILQALSDLTDEGALDRCAVRGADGRVREGFCHAGDEARAAALGAPPPRPRLLSPFDPLVSDRTRTERIFGWVYRVGIFTPAAKRTLGYYNQPVWAGDHVVGLAEVRVVDGRLCLVGAWPRDGHEASFERHLAAALRHHAFAVGAEVEAVPSLPLEITEARPEKSGK